ncbi:hypothetical protein PEC18_34490 [Paucibacter sp. O1-1]|nr:hypothetical protein [Paucibacter sp. O1-1]MDA3830797.1 hypothetical protein [Paucibacter sp. O1-1]
MNQATILSFLHPLGKLCINTTESTILNSLSFEKGDKISKKDLEEAQRLLRYEPSDSR